MRKTTIRLIRVCALGLLVMLAGVAQAQDTSSSGQFCVRAFEDLNGNGARDAGEQLIKDDIVANLQDAEGVVIATATIEESPSRGQGLICFRDLAPGQYSVFVTSAAWEPTGDANLTATVRAGQLPALLEFGGQAVMTSSVTASTEGAAADTDDDGLQRVLFATLGGLGAMVGMALLGVVLFMVFFRRRGVQAPASKQPATDPHAPFRPPPQNQRAGDDIYEDYQEFT